jgi:hypothetical protein
MNGFTRTPKWFERTRVLWFGPSLFVAVIWCSAEVEAAPIHRDHASSLIEPAKYQTWSQYLMGGPSVWSAVAHPALSPGIEAAMWKSIRTDPPPETSAVVNFFLYKQSLDAKRFDHFHPNVAKALSKIEAQLITPTTAPTTTATTTTSPATTTTSPTDQAQQLTPSVVPEPTTLFLTIGMTGYAVWWRRRRR